MIGVVVVDDNTDVRDALADLIRRDTDLRLLGTAANPDEALRVVTDTTPDVVLMDVKMRAGGAMVTRAVLGSVPATRVIALSAYDDRGALLQMIDAGAVGYVVKGCPAAEIVAAVRAAVRGDVPLSPSVSANLLHELSDRLEEERRDRDGAGERREFVQAAMSGLEIVLQPVVDLATGQPVGFEALSRFGFAASHAPARVFASAHEVGLGLQLEVAAVREALRHLRLLPPHTFLAVNVSPSTVSFGLLDEFVDAPATRLVLELTEHAAVNDYPALDRALAPLRAAGVRVAVDDAGAGFASLRHILRLAPDFIKLDHSLTAGLSDGLAGRAMAAALATFARTAGSRIVAEGVERTDQVHALRELGVELGQGYFLGPAAAPHEGMGR